MKVFICYDCEKILPANDAVNEVIDGLALCRACNRSLEIEFGRGSPERPLQASKIHRIDELVD